jgi:hypothetical protein
LIASDLGPRVWASESGLLQAHLGDVTPSPTSIYHLACTLIGLRSLRRAEAF